MLLYIVILFFSSTFFAMEDVRYISLKNACGLLNEKERQLVFADKKVDHKYGLLAAVYAAHGLIKEDRRHYICRYIKEYNYVSSFSAYTLTKEPVMSLSFDIRNNELVLGSYGQLKSIDSQSDMYPLIVNKRKIDYQHIDYEHNLFVMKVGLYVKAFDLDTGVPLDIHSDVLCEQYGDSWTHRLSSQCPKTGLCFSSEKVRFGAHDLRHLKVFNPSNPGMSYVYFDDVLKRYNNIIVTPNGTVYVGVQTDGLVQLTFDEQWDDVVIDSVSKEEAKESSRWCLMQ